MKSRLKRTLQVFGTLLVSYTLYALIAVPLIEPSIALAPPGPAYGAAPRPQSFEGLFPEGSWELDRPKVLDTEQGTLLFDDYQPLEDRRMMRLNRCTFIRFLDTGTKEKQEGEEAATKRRPIILQASSGAVLVFDRELDIPRGEFGDLVGGQLSGDVVIWGPPTAPDADDALRITTKEIQIDSKRIWTPHEVKFRFGPHHGSGRDLRIEWIQPQDTTTAENRALNGVKSLELVHLDKLEFRMHGDHKLELASHQSDVPAKPQASATRAPSSETPPAAELPTTPVEVACQGPCRFDVTQQVISLHDHVRVIRHNLNGPSDQLSCELLEVHLEEKPTIEGAPDANDGSIGSLQPVKIVALGYPVVVRVPSRGADARAERLEYDFRRNSIWLEDSKNILLSDARYRVEAKQLEYEAGEAGRLGRFRSQGPGHLWGKTGSPPRDFEATWEQDVQLRPYQDRLVLSLTGGASAVVAESGGFLADELHVYLLEVPKPGAQDKYDIVPDRMKALGNVMVDSQRLSAQLREANVWFRQPPAEIAVAADGRSSDPVAAVAAQRTSPQPTDEIAEGAKYDLRADMLAAQVILNQPLEVERLTVQGDLRFRQVQGDDDADVTVEGDRFELERGNTPDAQAVILGNSARVSARGMQLVGPRIELYRGQNQLIVNGPGSMVLPPQKTAQAPLPPFEIEWKGDMQFNGRTALFRREVTTRGAQRLKKGDLLHMWGFGNSLQVTLSQRVDFERPQAAKEVELHELAFDAETLLESQLVDPQGKRKMFQRMRARNLKVNQITGALRADGPGWISSVQQRGQWSKDRAVPLPKVTSASGLEYLRVDFSQQMRGRLHQGEVEFVDQVKSIYGPVDDWDETLVVTPSGAPGPEAITLTCQRLEIADMSPQAGSFAALELEATGNAFVQGPSFSATGQRISYVRSKDQLVMEGDGRNDALLSYQPQPGASPAELRSRKILFWPGTKQWELSDFHSLDARDLSGFRNPR